MNPIVNNHSNASLSEEKNVNNRPGQLRGRALTTQRAESAQKILDSIKKQQEGKGSVGIPVRSPSEKKIVNATDLSSSPKESKEVKLKASWSFLKKSASSSDDEITIQRQEKPEAKKTPVQANEKIEDVNDLSEVFKESKRTKTKTTWSFLKKSSSTSDDEIIVQRQESPESKKSLPLDNADIVVKAKDRLPHELVFEEIVQTELAFNNRLEVLIKCHKELESPKKGEFFNFINEKKGTEKGSKATREGLKTTGQDVLNELFTQAKQAKEYSNMLLLTLKNCSSLKEKAKLLAGFTFDNFRVMIKAYDQYTKFQQRLRPSEREKFFKKTDALIPLEEKQTTRLNFEGYASVLMQRLSRYALLLGELLKITKENPEFKEEFESLEIAHKRALEASKKSNEALKKSVRSFKFESEMSQAVTKPKKEQVDDLLKTLFSLSTESLNNSSDSDVDTDSSSEGKKIEN